MDNPVDLVELSDFVAVARAGSFAGAAKTTGTPKSTISKRVQMLEQSLNVRLFERTTRAVRLTADGIVLLERAARLVSEAAELERDMRERSGEPTGMLRVSVPAMLGLEFMGPVTAKLTASWPKMTIEVAFMDRAVDLLEENFDCAIRSGPMPDSSLIARRLAVHRNILVAPPRLAERLTGLDSPEALTAWPTISFAVHGVPVPWAMKGPERQAETRPKSAIILGSLRAAAAAAAAGGGVAFVPDMIAAAAIANGSLQRVLPDWSGPEMVIYLVYPAHRTPSAKLKAFADVLTSVFAEDADSGPDGRRSGARLGVM